MDQDTEQELERAIVASAKAAQDAPSASPDASLKYTQAALNAANAMVAIRSLKNDPLRAGSKIGS